MHPARDPRGIYAHGCGERLAIGVHGASIGETVCPYGYRWPHVHVPADGPEVCAAWCPGCGTDHVHPREDAAVTRDDVREAIRADIRAGHDSIRGLAKKYRRYGVDQSEVRGVMREMSADQWLSTS